MKKVKVGIIGIGNMGSAHCKLILEGKVPDIEIVAVADRREERREWIKENLPESVQVFNEGTDLIDSGICEAIMIEVPHYQHPELAQRAFAKKQHVLCEKPAGVYTKQVREMNEAAAKSDVAFAMMFNQRTNSVYRKMHEIIKSGELGEIMRVNWIITDWFRTQMYYDSGDWRGTWDGEGGGVLLNQCPHQLDLLQWICGMPAQIQAFCNEGKWHEIEVEDDVTAYLTYPNGATGVFITSTGDTPGTNRFEVSLEKGKLICESDKLILYRLEESAREFCKTAKEGFSTPKYVIEEIETDGENQQHVGVMNNFTKNILEGTSLIAGGEEGINGLMLSNAMHLSSWLKKPVSLPVDEDLFLEKLNERRATSVKKVGKNVTFATEGSY